jgi:CrcB protein
MESYLYLGIGGFFGTIGRYAVSTAISRISGAHYYLGTLGVNLTGSLLIGFLAALFLRPALLHPGFRLFFITGLLGGFTTFSSFSLETMKLLQEARYTNALMYAAVSLIGGVALAGVGWMAAKRLFES